MAVRIVEGVPGAGKTYFAVHHLLHTYFDWNDDLVKWVLKSEFADLVLITNIDSFDFALSLEDLLEQNGGIENFFTYEFQASFHAGKKIVYLIDEAQGLFPYKLYAPKVFLYFQKHRHLGHDVYLITQDADHLAKGLRTLAEFHVRAARRTLSVAGEFRYRFVDPVTDDCWKTKVLRRDGRIFNFYRSMTGHETEKLGSAPRRFIMITAALLLFGGVYLTYVFVRPGGFFANARALAPAPAADAVKVSSSSAPGGVPVPGTGAKTVPVNSSNPVPSKTASVPKHSFPSSRSDSLAGDGLATIIGVFNLGDGQMYLVEDGRWLYRLSEDDLVSACACHIGFLSLNSSFPFNPSPSRFLKRTRAASTQDLRASGPMGAN